MPSSVLIRRAAHAAALAAAIAGLATPVLAQDAVTLQLKWVAQSQFAGYYVAASLGFYAEENLAVTILPGGPDIAPPDLIAAGAADVIVEWMPAALAARERGIPLVNIAQPFKRSGLELTCLAASGVAQPADLRGRNIGVWFAGNEYPFLAWMARMGIPTEGGPDGITVVRQDFNVDPLLDGRADCISTMSYNEYWQVIDAGIAPEALTVFRYDEHGVATLEDGLYVLEDRLADPAFVDRMARFVRASMRGWEYAREHPDEAAGIVVDHDTAARQSYEHQLRMLGEINRLTAGTNGRLHPSDYVRTVGLLLRGDTDAVITREPVGAFTYAVTDAAGLF